MIDRLAVGKGFQTTAGFNNCFDVTLAGGGYLSIVNFYVEDLDALIEEGLTWPIAVQQLDKGCDVGIISDLRIHDSKFRESFCESCCPDYLLPLPQRLAHKRQEARGTRSVKIHLGKDGEPDMTIVSDKISINSGLFGAPPVKPISALKMYKSQSSIGAMASGAIEFLRNMRGKNG